MDCRVSLAAHWHCESWICLFWRPFCRITYVSRCLWRFARR